MRTPIPITYNIHCGFCGVVTATFHWNKFDIIPDYEINQENLGIEDSRCDTCLAIHGPFIRE